jgi:hypothetical protein
VLAVAACVAAAVVAPSYAAKAPKVVLGPNLLPNPGFEQSAIEPSPVPAYATSQPLLPTGWAFEGMTGLFDHGQHTAHSGKRAITISAPASGPDQFCQQKTCVQNPVDGPRNSAMEYYSETPFWRTLQAVPVTPGKTYQLSAWMTWTLETIGVGAITEVRWVDGNGVPVAITAGPSLIANARNSPALAYTKFSGLVKAPAGAVGAIVMLGSGNDAFISSMTYDDAYFGTYTTK